LYRFQFGELSRIYISIDIKPDFSQTMLPLWFKVDTGADISTVSKVSLEKKIWI